MMVDHLLSLFVVIFFCFDRGTCELLNVHVLFRHGDRSPIEWLPCVKPNKTIWPDGLGQLTMKGVEQEFSLGLWLQKRYVEFIGLNYHPVDFHMRSTDIDRTLMSAQSVMAGLYRNTTTKLDFPWRPIPVHTVRKSSDFLLSPSHCPKLDRMQKQQLTSAEMQEYVEKHQVMIDRISKACNYSIPLNRFTLWQAADTLICMQSEGLELPSWADDQLLDELYSVYMHIWGVQTTSTDEILRLEIGIFLSELIEHFKAVIANQSDHWQNVDPDVIDHYRPMPQKMMAYSAHDSDIIYLLGAFKNFTEQHVAYSSAIMIELIGPDHVDGVHKVPEINNQFRVRVAYKPGFEHEQIEYLPLIFCTDDSTSPEKGCQFDKFISALEPLLLKREEHFDACHSPRQLVDQKVVVIVSAVFVLIVFIGLVGLVVTCRRRRQIASSVPYTTIS